MVKLKIIKNWMPPDTPNESPAKSQTVSRYQAGTRFVVGVDGGGTKTHAVIVRANSVDANQVSQIIGEGIAGAGNPLRVGFKAAAVAVRDAIDAACVNANINRTQLAGAKIGLAGVRRSEVRAGVRAELKNLKLASFDVVTDADIALYGGVGRGAGLVIIAGTGSVCCGQDGRGRRACAGGWGPLAGDEGSAAWIARQALQRIAQAADGREPATALTKAVCDYFGIASPDELSMAIYAPEMTHARIAGLGRPVIEAAQAGDKVAMEIVCAAGRELGRAAVAVARRLRLGEKQAGDEALRVAYVGGVFAAGNLVLAPIETELASIHARVHLAPPAMTPALAAAVMAREQLAELALAM
ncbi:MAG: hypothetical protein MSG64_03175 [Pyrinomonadaceae bacterium MAG19_C2-C3]|nr:hypothetical protein [Pyrinomonadaceae bacterium MAG19_C2-C3]